MTALCVVDHDGALLAEGKKEEVAAKKKDEAPAAPASDILSRTAIKLQVK